MFSKCNPGIVLVDIEIDVIWAIERRSGGYLCISIDSRFLVKTVVGLNIEESREEVQL